jgi:hypothetical protein
MNTEAVRLQAPHVGADSAISTATRVGSYLGRRVSMPNHAKGMVSFDQICTSLQVAVAAAVWHFGPNC